MKASRVLLALVAFAATTMTVSAAPGPVTPPACQMACHKGEYAKVQACAGVQLCIDAIKSQVEDCTNACPPTPIMLGDPKNLALVESTPAVGGVACAAACKLTTKAASAACKRQKLSHRARCKENVAKGEDTCQAACVRIPAASSSSPVTVAGVSVSSAAASAAGIAVRDGREPACEAVCLSAAMTCFSRCPTTWPDVVTCHSICNDSYDSCGCAPQPHPQPYPQPHPQPSLVASAVAKAEDTAASVTGVAVRDGRTPACEAVCLSDAMTCFSRCPTTWPDVVTCHSICNDSYDSCGCAPQPQP